ncbi:MAG TPA: Ig-like domain-containing protein [Pseudonocardiaceae bacterium]|nr:Ig-like domain-containing protein [Pseudonocardiaceae bacterium]
MNRDVVRRAGLAAAAVLAVVTLGVGLVMALGWPTGLAANHAPGSGVPAGTITTVSPERAVQILPDGTAATNPTTPIVVRAEMGTLQSVTVVNVASGTVVRGESSQDRTTWTSIEPLGYSSSYRIDATATAGSGAPVQRTKTLTTLSPAAQAYPSLIPAPDSEVGVGQPIVVRFDTAVTDRAVAEKALAVTANPPQSGSWFWMSNTEVHYRPQSYWQPGSTVTVNARLYGVDLGDGVYGQTDRTETFRVHDAWIAKADGATKTMQIFDNDQLVKTMPISLGSPGFPTHNGPHVISDRQPSIIMDSCTYGVCKGQPGYYRERVDLDERISSDGEFVHSAPWSVGQQGDSNVSHGCVNLSPTNAQWFYDHFGLGDVVEITNSGGHPLPVWDTYGDWTLAWPQWQAGSAVQ